MHDPAIDFYTGSSSAVARRDPEVSDDRLEAVHDYILWLFPSPLNPIRSAADCGGYAGISGA